jgi:opacity protein-like surface antigen
MNRTFTASAVLALIAASPALAQEAHDWSGVYLGAHVGYSAAGNAADSLDCNFFDDGEFGGNTLDNSTLLESLTVSGALSNADAFCGSDPELAYGLLMTSGDGSLVIRPTSQNADPEFGYGYGSVSGGEEGTVVNIDFTDPEGPASTLDNLQGWLAGAQAGVLVQNDALVLGAEVSASMASIADSRDSYEYHDGGADPEAAYEYEYEYEGSSSTHTELNVDWTALAVARAGIAADAALFTVNGGLAMVGTTLKNSVSGTEDVCFDPDDPELGVNCDVGFQHDNTPIGGSWADSQTSVGWTVGAQVDLAIDESNSVFIGYSYVNVPNVRYQGQIEVPYYDAEAADVEMGPATQTYEYDLTMQLLKAGFNHKF